MNERQVMSEKSSAPLIYIILLNWNGREDTIDCLDSLKDLTYPNYSVVVVDNASADDSVMKINEWAERNNIPMQEYVIDPPLSMVKTSVDDQPLDTSFRSLHLVRSRTNTGFCAGNNIGMRLAEEHGADYLLILNNDTLCEPGLLEPLVGAAESDRGIGLLSSLICYADDRDTIWWGGGNFSKWLTPRYRSQGDKKELLEGSPPLETDWTSGCATFMPVRVYRELGGFDERFFIWCDEWDLSLRVRQSGYRTVIVPGSVLYHKVGKALGITSPLTFFYALRNMLIFRRRYMSRPKWILFITFYMPYKFVQALHYSLKYRDKSYWLGFMDIVADGLGNGNGIWKRQKKQGCK